MVKKRECFDRTDSLDNSCTREEPKHIRILESLNQLKEAREMLQKLYYDICGEGGELKETQEHKTQAPQPLKSLLYVLDETPTIIYDEVEFIRQNVIAIRERIL